MAADPDTVERLNRQMRDPGLGRHGQVVTTK